MCDGQESTSHLNDRLRLIVRANATKGREEVRNDRKKLLSMNASGIRASATCRDRKNHVMQRMAEVIHITDTSYNIEISQIQIYRIFNVCQVSLKY